MVLGLRHPAVVDGDHLEAIDAAGTPVTPWDVEVGTYARLQVKKLVKRPSLAEIARLIERDAKLRRDIMQIREHLYD